MKKTLLLCGLGLTVATSMVAGTMAIYTHTDTFLNADNSEVSGTAKKFYINTKLANSTKIENFKLAPGESIVWDFEVTNARPDNNTYISEVNTDLIVTLSSMQISNWQDLKVTLIQNGVESPLALDGDSLVIKKENAFLAGTAEVKTYSLKFTWDDKSSGTLGDDGDTALVFNKETAELPSISGITISVTGNQHVE